LGSKALQSKAFEQVESDRGKGEKTTSRDRHLGNDILTSRDEKEKKKEDGAKPNRAQRGPDDAKDTQRRPVQ